MPNRDCKAAIMDNADIGGPGVLASFIVIAWITLLLCAPRMINDVWTTWGSRGNILSQYLTDHQANRSLPKRYEERQRKIRALENGRPLCVKTLERLIEPIYDLQLITGLGIIIAAWSQNRIPQSISLYHQQQAMSCWYLTLNSFWAARRPGHLSVEAGNGRTPSVLCRRLLVLCNCVLAASFQIKITLTEKTLWDNFHEGLCYKYLYEDELEITEWFWAASNISYSAAILIQLVPAVSSIFRGDASNNRVPFGYEFADGIERLQCWSVRKHNAALKRNNSMIYTE